MDKNILIIGAARSGKTTLAKKLSKEKGYNVISIDDIVSGFEAYPDLKIAHDSNDVETSKNLSPFLIKYLTELSEGNKFYDGVKYVIEGTHIDFETLMPFLQSDKYREKYDVIGLTYNYISEEKMFDSIKKHDTEDDWTYWVSDDDLKGDVRYFLQRNAFFNEKFKEYNIESFDTSNNREEVLNQVVEYLSNNQMVK